jgi:hypothetical protein
MSNLELSLLTNFGALSIGGQEISPQEKETKKESLSILHQLTTGPICTINASGRPTFNLSLAVKAVDNTRSAKSNTRQPPLNHLRPDQRRFIPKAIGEGRDQIICHDYATYIKFINRVVGIHLIQNLTMRELIFQIIANRKATEEKLLLERLSTNALGMATVGDGQGQANDEDAELV